MSFPAIIKINFNSVFWNAEQSINCNFMESQSIKAMNLKMLFCMYFNSAFNLNEFDSSNSHDEQYDKKSLTFSKIIIK
jgi:hypothetical protein